MDNASSSGRPALRRNKTAGDNLRAALKLLGKTWRKNSARPNHVRNWTAWTNGGLPSSATTIDRDIRDGIPEQRIAAYALCLGLSPKSLCSPSIDLNKALGSSPAPADESRTPIGPENLPFYHQRYQQYNNPAYIRDLFALMGGVYRMNYLLQGIDLIHRCTLWVYSAETHHLRMRGRFIMFGRENPLEAVLFRWHNSLHTHYLCDNGMELGYTLSIDPLRFDQVRQRRPLWLRGTGMTDRGLEDNQPITLMYRMNQLPVPRGMTLERFWKREYQDMQQRPFLSPGEPGYDAIWTSIQTPEVLL